MQYEWFKVGSLSLACVTLLGCNTVEVSGVVRDDTTQRPIEGATVRIGEETTSTDNGGFYSFEIEGDDEDSQKFNIQAPGYLAQSDIRLVDDDVDPLRLDFTLKAEPGNTRSNVEAPRAPVDVNVHAEADSDAKADGEHDPEHKIERVPAPARQKP